MRSYGAVVTYQDAETQFNNTRKPPRSKKYLENQRPLRRVSEDWLMLQKDAHSYVYKIGQQEVVRLFEPDQAGEYEVAVRTFHATYDLHQLYKQTGYHNRITLETSTGTRVCVPLNAFWNDQGKEFSAMLTFNHNHQLVVEKSWHADVYLRKSSSTDKAKRKSIKQQLDAYVTLQLFKLPTLRERARPTADQARPFGEFEGQYSDINILRAAFKEDEIPVGSQAFAEAFDSIAQSAFDMLASKRVWNDVGDGSRGNDGSRLLYAAQGNNWYTQNDPNAQAKAQDKIAEIVDAITPEDFKTSLVQTLMKFAGLAQGSDFVPLPQFPDKLPNRFYLYRKG
jgi:hypothetical protein